MSAQDISAQDNPLTAGHRPAAGRIALAGLTAVAAAVAANLIARAVLFAALPLPAEFPPLGIAPITIFTTLGVGLGALVYALIYRLSRRPQRTFTIVAVIALVLSILPNLAMMANPTAIPFPFPGASGMAFGVLIVFHIIAGVIAITVLIRVK